MRGEKRRIARRRAGSGGVGARVGVWAVEPAIGGGGLCQLRTSVSRHPGLDRGPAFLLSAAPRPRQRDPGSSPG
ncbi:hypothetical protein EWH08_05515 [Sphingobium indicum]|uniref:Uncharacterized protein n=1 Tax=Sphingobium indicum TaxID=332055 RepID=A0A4Q4JDX8_9SPHN|nr:hypothetical protein EWH08_05515 [Sphingobium indicum]